MWVGGDEVILFYASLYCLLKHWCDFYWEIISLSWSTPTEDYYLHEHNEFWILSLIKDGILKWTTNCDVLVIRRRTFNVIITDSLRRSGPRRPFSDQNTEHTGYVILSYLLLLVSPAALSPVCQLMLIHNPVWFCCGYVGFGWITHNPTDDETGLCKRLGDQYYYYVFMLETLWAEWWSQLHDILSASV